MLSEKSANSCLHENVFDPIIYAHVVERHTCYPVLIEMASAPHEGVQALRGCSFDGINVSVRATAAAQPQQLIFGSAAATVE